MFNKKKKKIERLEMLLQSMTNRCDNLLKENREKEQSEICKLPEVPKVYQCHICQTVTHKEMKMFRTKSYDNGKWCQVYMCKSCLDK